MLHESFGGQENESEEGKKEKAIHELRRKLETLDVGVKTGIHSVLGMFTIRGFDGKKVSDAFNNVVDDIWKDAQFVGNKRDGRLERLAWLITDQNNEVGNTLSVAEMRKIFEEEGIHYNPNW